MKKCMVTGSFDPFTKGHLDMVRRASKLFDKVYVAILVNPIKKNLFNKEDRFAIIKKACEDLDNIAVISYAGMTVDIARELGVDCLIRGIRSESDLEYEIEMSEYNLGEGGIDTVCFLSNNMSFISSTEVRRRVVAGESLEGFVPDNTIELVEELYKKRIH